MDDYTRLYQIRMEAGRVASEMIWAAVKAELLANQAIRDAEKATQEFRDFKRAHNIQSGYEYPLPYPLMTIPL